jgi:hypothetical protein
MKRQIEDYLRARGARFFRGHHDDEYFFLADVASGADFPSGTYRVRLNVHLEACDTEPGTVLVTLSPDRYYSVQNYERLRDLAGRWNAAHRSEEAVVHGSSDPALVGVFARSRIQACELPVLTDRVDAAIVAAAELFRQVAAVSTAQAPVLRDVG